MINDKYEYLYDNKEEPDEAFLRLFNIIKILRIECPWDKIQTHETLIPCMKEETYEAIDAIYNKNIENLREELGDVLLQVVFHGIIAEETSEFELSDVINEECEKMIRRHPHVFSEKEDKSIDKVLETWENIKCSEHSIINKTDKLRSVPKTFPALIRSYKIQKKAAEVGFDWEDINGAIDKIDEETIELKEAIIENDYKHISEELGDLLFAVVNVARFAKVNPEESLVNTSEKFINRFNYIEEEALNMGETMEKLSLEEMETLWNKAKEKGL
ncbi:MAG: nucleoside triphosphate pyrophosphohydrolase [Peptostreptococcaceae bacterium]|nr:nucleoside triphosphate pyrophosphohydrolase [Peptostreptococcaceae bacterium]